ncbi:hypothetical protein [Fibrobacter succinogenes]|uniref:hypothetical protein n=1 Tax=Fibrobacter succinogenes TaxID=833 RepID=UPI001563F815|nr:hypothetical protein [Fibrobacter succinogenes]
MKKILTLCISFAALLSGCSMTHDYGHVEQFDMEVPAAPELRGVGNYQEPKTFKVRASGNVHMGKTEKEKLSGITNKMENCSGITNCRGFKSEEVREKVDGTYNITYPIVTASIDLLAKRNWFMWGGSVSFNKGMSADLIIGANTKYFEAGLSIGAWMYTRKFNYSGTQYSCDQFLVWEDFSRYFFEDSSTTGVTLTYGGFASIYNGPISFNFSFSVYRPDPAFPTTSGGSLFAKEGHTIANFDMPLVMTEYFTVGYRITDRWEARMGIANTLGEFRGWHWSAMGGISYYLK